MGRLRPFKDFFEFFRVNGRSGLDYSGVALGLGAYSDTKPFRA